MLIEQVEFKEWTCPDCGSPDCVHTGITCQYCDRGCSETEIYHVCSSLGTICLDCDSSGEYPEYWEPESEEEQDE